MVSVFTRPMCDIDTNEDARTYEGQGKRKYPVRDGDPAKEGTPNTRPGYKLAAVSVTMYINSHTSF